MDLKLSTELLHQETLESTEIFQNVCKCFICCGQIVACFPESPWTQLKFGMRQVSTFSSSNLGSNWLLIDLCWGYDADAALKRHFLSLIVPWLILTSHLCLSCPFNASVGCSPPFFFLSPFKINCCTTSLLPCTSHLQIWVRNPRDLHNASHLLLIAICYSGCSLTLIQDSSPSVSANGVTADRWGRFSLSCLITTVCTECADLIRHFPETM